MLMMLVRAAGFAHNTPTDAGRRCSQGAQLTLMMLVRAAGFATTCPLMLASVAHKAPADAHDAGPGGRLCP